MSDFLLAVNRRDMNGPSVASLRRRGFVPAVVYGHNAPTVTLTVKAGELQKLWRVAGESTLFDLKVESASPVKAIIQDVQLDPATDKILHVDFHQVKMTEKLEIEVDLEFTGEAPAVKELGGTLLKLRDKVKVECLPTDLVKSIIVDTSGLKTFDDAIHMRDLVLPKGLELKEVPDDGVAQVEPPRSEEELKALDESVEEDVTKVEKIEKPAKEEGEEVTATDTGTDVADSSAAKKP